MVYLLGGFNPGSFDSSVHISEEASNAATAIPWAILNSLGIGCILGFGMSLLSKDLVLGPTDLNPTAINIALAFCMGGDLQSLVNSNQPMAQIFLNGFGSKPTLGIWAVVIIVQ
jgi:amino acid transporter